MADNNGGENPKTGTSSSTPPGNGNNPAGGGGVIIEESQESEEYQQDLQVVLGTAFGVIAVVGLVALTFLLYRVYKARRRALSNGQYDENDPFDGNVSIDVSGKSQPVVLLLYANDCPIHERVVGALAGFLMETCGVTITLDLLEETEILERGIDDWLVDRLQESDYILVLCSLGARLRCSKKRVRFKQDSRQILPDYFAVAVDYVAEKMRVEKQKGLSTNKVVTAYMEYSTRSDIPPQLESAVQFCLMKDVHALHSHLNTFGPEPDKSDSGSQQSTCEDHYHETDTGAILRATIEQAKTYFKENPSWMDKRIEQVDARVFSLKPGRNRKLRRNSMEQPLLMLTGSPPVLKVDNKTNNQQSLLDSKDNLASSHVPITSSSSHQLPISQDTDRTKVFSYTATEGGKFGSTFLHGSGVFHSRQNSLPSSLSSSCVVAGPGLLQKGQPLSKSMDSFSKEPGDEGLLPCFYCNSSHLLGSHGSCRKAQGSSKLAVSSQTSLLLQPSHSQTILQAEVHHEWSLGGGEGTSRLTALHEQKSLTLAGEPQLSSVQSKSPALPTYQSLPPHHAPPPALYTSEWDSPVALQRWHHHRGSSDNPTRPIKLRTLSDNSFSTEDSQSVSEVDSLERDLQAIQHISSFQDFVNSSSFLEPTSSANLAFKSLPRIEFEMSSQLKPLSAKCQVQDPPSPSQPSALNVADIV